MAKKSTTKKGISIEARLSLNDALAQIEELVKNFKAGVCTIQKGPEAIVIKPQQEVNFELKVTQKKDDKEKMSIELSWQRPPTPVTSDDFKIIPGEVALPAQEETSPQEETEN